MDQLIKIPKEFTIFGLKFKVKQVKKVDEADSWGSCDIESRTIKLKKALDKENKEVTYIHELTHAILDSLEYKKLSNDEKFVEDISRSIHQIIKSSVYETKK